MTAPNRWRVDDSGRPGDIDILVNGVNVASSVSSYAITNDANGRAQLTLQIRGLVETTVVGDTEPRWHGLERVPADALRAELELRDADPNLEPTPWFPDTPTLAHDWDADGGGEGY